MTLKIPRVARPSKDGVIQGWNPQDQRILDQENPTLAPKTDLFVSHPEDLQEEQQQQRFCPKCDFILTPIEKFNDEVMQCRNCSDIINGSTLNNDLPLRNVNQSMRPFQSQFYDPNNPEGVPYFASWSPDRQADEQKKNYEVVYDTGRIKHIKCKGFPQDISINAFDD